MQLYFLLQIIYRPVPQYCYDSRFNSSRCLFTPQRLLCTVIVSIRPLLERRLSSAISGGARGWPPPAESRPPHWPPQAPRLMSAETRPCYYLSYWRPLWLRGGYFGDAFMKLTVDIDPGNLRSGPGFPIMSTLRALRRLLH